MKDTIQNTKQKRTRKKMLPPVVSAQHELEALYARALQENQLALALQILKVLDKKKSESVKIDFENLSIPEIDALIDKLSIQVQAVNVPD